MNSKLGKRRFSTLWLILRRFLAASLTVFLFACTAAPTSSSSSTTEAPAKEIVLYNWPDYMPQSVLDKFEKEYGTKVIAHTYNSQEEAVEKISNGEIQYDIAVIEYDILPLLVSRSLLAEVNHRNIPNFENVSASFRDLSVDPGNRYSVPYNWGTSGLIVRSDLTDSPITRWSDLWDPRYAGKIALREQPTELISIALLSLGYPLNSENPAQLEAALERLLELKKSAIFITSDVREMVDTLKSGEIIILQGWNGDALMAREEIPDIQYVLPAEGTMLWSDTFVISAESRNQYTAEVFIDFVLRPEISAEIAETYYYPSANEAAGQFIDPDILNDPIAYPPVEYLTANCFYEPLSENGKKLYDDMWERFLEGD